MKYQFTTRLEEMNFPQIHAALAQAYWCRDIPFEVLKKAVENSLCFGLVHDTQQLAFGRFVTDQATFAYLADVFVIEPYQGLGLSKPMLEQAMNLSQIKGLRRMMLATRDAHGLYEKFGFSRLLEGQSELFMQQHQDNIYA